MENHPIPQDVTGFQFKLIGNMTVKQFAYLASGIVFAWILLQLPIHIALKLPLGIFSAISGAGLAFLPISGRPMDLMIANYIKALFRPTQFVYGKVGGQIYFPNKTPLAIIKSVKQYKNGLNPLPKDKLKIYLESLQTKSRNAADEEESVLASAPADSAINTSPPKPTIDAPLDIPELKPQTTPFKYSDSSEPLRDIFPKKSTPPASLEKKREGAASRVAKEPAKNIAQSNLSDSPNIIEGIVKDPRGNALPGILIEVKDKEGNPVRAFKTNEVGRFASATPLMNGVYGVDFEDPKSQNKFEKIVINVTGQVILPIEITSIDTREELRRSLFRSN